MSNTNNTMQTQTSNAFHNAIMEAGSKDRPQMLAPESSIQIQMGRRGSSETTTERYMENYKNVSQEIRDQLNAEAEAVQIILIGIDNDIYSTVDACPNACEMWKAIERLKQGIDSDIYSTPQSQENVPHAAGTVTTSNELDLLFSLMFDELLNGSTQVTSNALHIAIIKAGGKDRPPMLAP
nr:hypothetical protein [Tanacetum cinerariifolium]